MHDRDRFDQFTERARKVLSLAQEEAQRFQHNYIGTEHLLLGLVREGEGVAAKVLINMGAELHRVRTSVEFIIGRGDRIVLGEIGLTPRAKKVIELAVAEARSMHHHYIGTEHLLLGLLREGEGIAAGVLESLGISLEKTRQVTLEILRGSPPHGQQTPDIPYPAMEPSQLRVEYTTDQPRHTASVLQDEDDITPAPSAGDTDPYDGFSVRARRVIETAEAEARAFQHNVIGTEHLLLGLLREEKGIAVNALRQLGIDHAGVRIAVESIRGHGDSPVGAEISLTPLLRNVIAQAREEARLLNHHYIGTEHLLLALAKEKQGPAAGILENMGIAPDRVTIHVYLVLGQALSLRLSRLYPDLSAHTSQPVQGRFSRFTERARKVFHHAQVEAQRFQHNYIGTEHLLLGLLDQGEGVAIQVLTRLGVSLDLLRGAIEERMQLGDQRSDAIGLTPRARRVIDLAVEEARRMNHHYIGTEHLLLGLLHTGEGIAAGVLTSLGVTLENAREMTIRVLGEPPEGLP